MRLTLVISSLGRGGAERALSLLANAWAEQGKEITVLRLDHGQAPAYPIDASVKLSSLGLLAESHNPFQGIWRNFYRIRILRRAISESQPDIVVSFMDRTNVLTLLATRGLGYPVAVSEQNDPRGYNVGKIWSALRRMMYPFADALVCPTSSLLAHFQAAMKIKVYAIPNPFPLPPGATQSRTRPGGEQAKYILVALGRLVPEKGFDILLNAFAQVAKRHPEWSLTIMGGGPLRNDLEEQTARLGLSAQIHLAGEVLDPFPTLCEADLFVCSSRTEGFGIALCEAMACGLPVVAFDCPSGPRDIIRHEVDGVLVPSQDMNALAAALDRLMGNAQERQRLAARATEVVVRFSTDSILGLWQRLFDTLQEEA